MYMVVVRGMFVGFLPFSAPVALPSQNVLSLSWKVSGLVCSMESVQSQDLPLFWLYLALEAYSFPLKHTV